jgi:Tol biopolymer transport system component/predicted Ser/Thr protein kinase
MNEGMIGKTISHYTILEKLGQGGMGVVYKAEDTTLDRVVALKFLPPHLAESAADKARFVQEAKAAAALNHPNVCSIYEIAEHEGQMFIVMEFVDGETLRHKRGSLTLKQAADIGIQIADGLAAAHEKGIVHRDIKPENIMIRRDGICQIMDFGLAKLRSASSQVNRLTKEGSTVGTAGYMSPEQVQGHDVDHRSDIFSFGVVLYEMFTGELPFKGVHETALAYEIVNVDPAPMSSVKPEIDPALDAIVLDCLEKDVKERCQSVAEVARDLRRIRRESTRARASRVTAARPAIKVDRAERGADPPASRWKMYAGYLLAAVIVAAGAAVWFLQRPGETVASNPPMRLSINLPENAPLSSGQGEVALSRDGKTLVYVGALPNGRGQLYLHHMDQPGAVPIPGTEGGLSPAFSPDGQWVAFNAQNGKICKVSITGSVPEELCPAQVLTRGITWPTAETIYAGLISGGIVRVPASGGPMEPVTKVDSAAGELSHRFPQLLPDGKSIIYTVKLSNIASFDEALIVAERIGGGGRKVLVRGGTYGRYLPTGQIMFVRNGKIYAQDFDAAQLEVRGAPVEVAEGGWMLGGSGESVVAVSDAGLMVFAPVTLGVSDQFSIGWIDRTGAVTPLSDTLRWYNAALLSPDGQRIGLGINAANDDIWVYQIARGVLTRLTFGGGNNDFPIWSPDGKYLVYSAEKGGKPNLFRKAWDGSGVEQRLTKSPNLQIPVSFSPDGKMLAYDEGGDIWLLPVDSSGGGTPRPFIQSPAQEVGGLFSPDGRWVAYQSNESGKDEVYVAGYPNREGKWQVTSGGGILYCWTKDGSELLFFANGAIQGVRVLPGTTFDFSQPQKLFNVPSNVLVWDVSPDGRRFLALVSKNKTATLPRLDVLTDWLATVGDKLQKH